LYLFIFSYFDVLQVVNINLLKFKRTIEGNVIDCTYHTIKDIIPKVQDIKLINHKGEN